LFNQIEFKKKWSEFSCINGYLKNKTRILVTHQVHHLETAENIVIIKNGQIESKGKYDELAKTSLKSYITEADEERDDEIVEEENEVEKELKVIKKKEKVMTEEMKAKEEVKKLINKWNFAQTFLF
jgi:ABC-type multidrug transport system ATPase subunit